MFRSGDFFEDLAGGFGPDEGFRVPVVVIDVFHDGSLELGNAFEDASSADAVAGNLGEEPLDHIEPGCRGGHEVQVEAGMLFKPALYGGGLMCGVVIGNQMQIGTGRDLLIDLPEKVEELLRPVPRQASADDLAIEHVQRCKQRSGFIALLVVLHRSAALYLFA